MASRRFFASQLPLARLKAAPECGPAVQRPRGALVLSLSAFAPEQERRPMPWTACPGSRLGDQADAAADRGADPPFPLFVRC